METMTVDEAAALLKIHPVTLCAKAAQGIIPGARVGKRWVFVKVDLIDHIRAQYPLQATQGVTMEKSSWHSTNGKIPQIGGSRSRQPTDDAYSKALGLQRN